MVATKRKITINPVTRIEGHGKITLHLDDEGRVSDAKFHVTSFRGFEKFSEGRLFWEMPLITPRICGICPVSHHLASAKACDAIMGVEIPPTAAKLRRLMHMAQFVQSHSLHFFYLASPDLLFGMDSDPAKRNIIGVVEANPELAKVGVGLRSFGQRIIETLGSKRVHPNFAIPGGVNRALLPEERDSFLKETDGVIKNIQLALSIVKDYCAKAGKELDLFASFPTGYLGLVDENGNLELYDGKLTLKDSKGIVLEDKVDPRNYLSIIEERVEDWSYLKFPFYKKMGYPAGIYRVGPLARLNVASGISTPLAAKEFKEFKKLAPNGMVQGSLYYHYARMIEDLYAAEELKSLLLDKDICSQDLHTTSTQFNEEGVGVVEAPRGTLIHHYWVDSSGRITKANLIVSTGNNNPAMNRAVLEVARRYVDGTNLKEGMLNRLEVAIRCYDPCLSCSAHALGQMPLLVQLLSPTGEVVDEAVRG